MLVAIGIIGKGDSFGIHARLYPVSDPAVPDSLREGSESPAFPGSVVAAIRDRWAPLFTNVIPANAGLHLLKVSRHRDDQSRIWTWIGYYQFTEFDRENRGGHYFGVGIAFCDALVAGDVGGFLDSQLNRLASATLLGNRMARSIFDINFRVEPVEIQRRLSFKHLPEELGGISPEATLATFQQEMSWTSTDVERMVHQSLHDPGQQEIGGRFFGNWSMAPAQSTFYMADNEGTARARSAVDHTYSASASSNRRVKVASPTGSGGGLAASYVSNAAANADVSEYIVERLEIIDRKITDLSKHMQRVLIDDDGSSHKKSGRKTLDRALVILSSTLFLALCSFLLWKFMLP